MPNENPKNTISMTVKWYPEPLQLEKENNIWYMLDNTWKKSALWWMDFDFYCACSQNTRILWQQKIEDGVVCAVLDRGAFHESFVIHVPNDHKMSDIETGTRITGLRFHEKILNTLTGKRNSPKNRPFDNKMVNGAIRFNQFLCS